MSVHKYSTTADSNTSVGDGGDAVSIAEGMPRGDVNNAMRAIVADIAKDYRDCGGITSAGTGSALTLATASDITALASGIRLTFKAHAAIEDGATLNVNGIGARAIKANLPGGIEAVKAGGFAAGSYVQVVYDGTDFVCVNAPRMSGAVSFDSFDDMIASGSPLSEGQKITTFTPVGVYKVAASDATDHHFVTSGGVKVYDIAPIDRAAELRQRRQYDPVAGFDNGVSDTQIFPGSRLPPQGICRLTVAGVEYDFIALRDDTDSSNELFRIVQYEVETGANVAISGILDINHCQDLSGSVDDLGVVTLYSQMNDTNGSSKGVSVIDWVGAATSQANISSYQLLGSSGSGHRLERYTSATVGVGYGRLVLLANDTKGGVDDTGHTMLVYDMAEILAASDPLDLEPIAGPCPIYIGAEEGQNTMQGCDVQADHVRLLRGFINPRQRKLIQFWDFRGNLIREIEFAGVLNDYTEAELGDHPTLGSLITFEPEGITSDDLGRIVLIHAEEWRAIGDVVSWEGKNFTPRRGSVTSTPATSDDWVETTATASGAWASGTYTWGGNYTARHKAVHVIDKPLASGADKPLGSHAQFNKSLSLLKTGSNSVDLTLALGGDFLVAGFMAAVNKTRRLFGYYSERSLRFFDAREGSNNSSYASIGADFRTNRQVMDFRSNGSLSNGAGFNLYGKDDSVAPGAIRFWATTSGGSAKEVLRVNIDEEEAILHLPGLPASDFGLDPGDVYRDASGNLKVVN